MDGDDPFEESKGVFQSSEGGWGFQSNAGFTTAANNPEEDDLDDEERERVEKAEADWEEKKRGFFEF